MDDDNPPHFHALLTGQSVQIKIADLTVLSGSIPPAGLALVEPDPQNLRLTLRWKSGATTVKDMRKDIARRALFAALSDPRVFRRMRVLDDGYSIGWPGTAIDLAADALWYQAHPREMPIFDKVMTPADFKRWMQSQGLSLSSAAEVLGLSRRSVAYYASGKRTIPPLSRSLPVWLWPAGDGKRGRPPE